MRARAGRVLAGAYPASLDDAETDAILTALLRAGVNTFVCLQAEVSMFVPTHLWRAGAALRPYIKDAQRLLSTAAAQEGDGSGGSGSGISQRKLDLLHLPIQDGSVTTDLASELGLAAHSSLMSCLSATQLKRCCSAVSRLADDCCARVLRGEKLYIHCWCVRYQQLHACRAHAPLNPARLHLSLPSRGGHGRTGTLVAILLGRLYGLPCTSALRLTQAYHDSRVFPQGVRSPQTPVQRAQVSGRVRMHATQTSCCACVQGAATSCMHCRCRTGAASAAAAAAAEHPSSTAAGERLATGGILQQAAQWQQWKHAASTT